MCVICLGAGWRPPSSQRVKQSTTVSFKCKLEAFQSLSESSLFSIKFACFLVGILGQLRPHASIWLSTSFLSPVFTRSLLPTVTEGSLSQMVCKCLLSVAIFQPGRQFSAAFYQTFPLPLSPDWSHSLGFAVATTSFPGLGVSVSQFWRCNNYKILAKCKIRAACLEVVVGTGGTQPLPCVQSAWLPDPGHGDGTH